MSILETRIESCLERKQNEEGRKEGGKEGREEKGRHSFPLPMVPVPGGWDEELTYERVPFSEPALVGDPLTR